MLLVESDQKARLRLIRLLPHVTRVSIVHSMTPSDWPNGRKLIGFNVMKHDASRQHVAKSQQDAPRNAPLLQALPRREICNSELETGNADIASQFYDKDEW
jgi:hypothetical protein